MSGQRYEGSPDVSEAELLDLFERRRPSEDAFRQRIADRIAERTREAEASTNQDAGRDASSDIPMESSSGWRRAAALLPIPTSASKMVPVALAWPFFALAAGIGGFVFGRRALVKS
ncbi:MAG: hypothetical protein AAGG01_02725, partial [Planctomycetota bacterium]